jgi:hypothetical protein
MVIYGQVNGLGNLHIPPPGLNCIMLMRIGRAYHNFLNKSDKFWPWQGIFYFTPNMSLDSLGFVQHLIKSIKSTSCHLKKE